MSGVNPLMNKWLFIQALRGVAVLGVVAFHSMSIEKKYSSGDLLLPDFDDGALCARQGDAAISLGSIYPHLSNVLVLLFFDSCRLFHQAKLGEFLVWPSDGVTHLFSPLPEPATAGDGCLVVESRIMVL